MKKKRQKTLDRIPLYPPLDDPRAPACAPGSIEQQLDMCEEGPRRGEEILRDKSPIPKRGESATPVPLDQAIENNFNMDMAEPNREGDDLSGDERALEDQDLKTEELEKRRVS